MLQKKNLLNAPNKTLTGADYAFKYLKCDVPIGTYIFSYDTTAAASTCEFGLVGNTTTAKKTYHQATGHNEIQITTTEITNKAYLFVNSAGDYSNFMLRNANITDDTFEPYIDDVDTRITDNKNDIAINKITLGYQKKNLLNNANVTKTEGGVTFTVNADKSVSLSGTSTGQVFLYFDFDEQLINNQKVILSGCPSGGNSNTYALALRYYNENGTEQYVFDTGSGITVTPADMIQIMLIIRAGVNTDGLIFYPMLRNANTTDDTYEPYVKSVKERFESQTLVYSNTTSGSSPLTLTVSNLFVDYSAVICNMSTSNGSYSVLLPLRYIKSLGTSAYYTAEDLMFYYVDDSNIKISTGLGQTNPTINSIKIVGLY
jgi:hypothetical protein